MTVRNMPPLPAGFYWNVGEPEINVTYQVASGKIIDRRVTVQVSLCNNLDPYEEIESRVIGFSTTDDSQAIEKAIRDAARKIFYDNEKNMTALVEHYSLLQRLKYVVGRADGKRY